MDTPAIHSRPAPEALRWAAKAVGAGAVVRAVWPLAGGTSSALYGLDIEHRGRRLGLVLRLFDNTEWLQEEPDLAAHEAAALQRAQGATVSTPEPVAWDETGEHAGVPAVLMTRLPGAPELNPDDLDEWLSRLAEAILPVHRVEASDFPWRFRRYNHALPLETPTWSLVPELWERAQAIVAGPPPPARPCFIHRDYHPMNVLWYEGRVSGIVDWVNGCIGPAAIDAAWCRGNLIHLHGIGSADRFLQHFLTLAGPHSDWHPFWDLMVIVEALPGPPSVYPPWAAHGIGPQDARAVRDRWEEYLAHVLRQF